MEGVAVMGTATADINELRRELLWRLDRQRFDDCPPELLRAFIAVFDVAFGGPPPDAPTPGFRPYLVK